MAELTDPSVSRARRGISWVVRYGAALLGPLAALGLTMLLVPVQARAPFAVFYAAVAGAAWLGGFGPGLVATLLSMVLVDYYIVPPSARSAPSRRTTWRRCSCSAASACSSARS